MAARALAYIGTLTPLHANPIPSLHGPDQVPNQFLIYTPPPPKGQKEDRMHKIHRKWEEDVRSAKTGTAKTASWQGVKSKATNGISWAM
jgi:hypothetical protein